MHATAANADQDAQVYAGDKRRSSFIREEVIKEKGSGYTNRKSGFQGREAVIIRREVVI